MTNGGGLGGGFVDEGGFHLIQYLTHSKCFTGERRKMPYIFRGTVCKLPCKKPDVTK